MDGVKNDEIYVYVQKGREVDGWLSESQSNKITMNEKMRLSVINYEMFVECDKNVELQEISSLTLNQDIDECNHQSHKLSPTTL